MKEYYVVPVKYYCPVYYQSTVQTGISNFYLFDVYTIYNNLTYLYFDYGDETFETFNITGNNDA